MRKVLAAALMFAALGLGPAAAIDWVPNLRTERVYFHCEGATKAHNSATDGSIGWNATAPTQSVTAGAGCGSLDNPLMGSNQVSVQDTHFEGDYAAANLDSMTVELHNIYVGGARAGGPLSFNVRLLVDDVPRLGVGGKEVSVVPVRSSSGASEMVRFTVTGLNLLTELDNMDHHVLMTISGGKFTANGQAFPIHDTASGWVYDSTEVPAGITFNPATPEAVTVAADPIAP